MVGEQFCDTAFAAHPQDALMSYRNLKPILIAMEGKMSLRLLLADLLLASFAFKNKRFNAAILHAFRVHKISTVVCDRAFSQGTHGLSHWLWQPQKTAMQTGHSSSLPASTSNAPFRRQSRHWKATYYFCSVVNRSASTLEVPTGLLLPHYD